MTLLRSLLGIPLFAVDLLVHLLISLLGLVSCWEAVVSFRTVEWLLSPLCTEGLGWEEEVASILGFIREE